MIKINRYFIPYMLLLILIIGIKGDYIVAFIVVFFHEIIHYITARSLKISGADMEFLPIGTVLRLENLNEATPKQDLIISLAGPMVNLIFALIFYLLNKYTRLDIYYKLFYSNITLGVFNIIPAFPLDGGRVLRDILSYKYLYKKANAITVEISIFIGILMMFGYIFLFFGGVNNLNIGVISILIIISSIKEKERIVYIIMGDIIKKKYNFLKRGFIQSILISVHCKKDLVNIMSIVEKGRYNIFIVLDDEMGIMGYISEEEVINGLKQYGNIKIEELLKYKVKDDF